MFGLVRIQRHRFCGLGDTAPKTYAGSVFVISNLR
jgi:hypothetical protein